MPVLPFAAGIPLLPGVGQRLVFIFFLGNGVGIGMPALRSQANQRILRDIVFLQILRSEEHTSELQSHLNLVCRLLLEKKKRDFRISKMRETCRCSTDAWSYCD